MGYNRFRKSASKVKNRKSQNRGGYDRPAWATTYFQMDVGEDPAKVRVIDPGPEGFFCVDFHRVNGFDRRCTCEMPEFDGKCVYCHYYESEDDRESWERKNLYQRFRWIVELLDFRFGHEVEEARKDGDGTRKIVARCASDDAIPKFKRGRSCKYCDQKIPRIFGGHKLWELSNQGFEPLRDLDLQLQQTAFRIVKEGDEEKIQLFEAYTTGFICANCGDSCKYQWKGETIEVDEKAIGMLSDEDPEGLEDFAADEEHECEGCGHVGLPVETWVAVDEDDKEYEGCERLTLFDQSLEVMCSGRKSKDGKRTFRDYNFSKDAYEMCHVLDELKEYGFPDKELEEMITPMDLHHKYRPEWIDPNDEKYEKGEADYVSDVLNAQAKQLQRARGDNNGESYPNPYEEQKTKRQSKPFSNSKFRGRR